MTIKITVNFDRVRLFLNNSKVTVLNGSTSERYVEAYLSFHFHYSAFSRKVRINLALIREILKAVKEEKNLWAFLFAYSLFSPLFVKIYRKLQLLRCYSAQTYLS